MVSISGISKAYGGRTLFEDVSLQVNRQDRIALVAPNGAGKSTFFQILLGNEEPDAGTISCQRGLSLGYLPQENAPAGDETVLELASSITPEFESLYATLRAADHSSPEFTAALARFQELDGQRLQSKAKQILAGLAFRPDQFERPLRELSGGWVMRAHLARLLVQEPDLLMLDEPTNHLDLEALLWLQDYLGQYPGAILLISHDREFLNQLAGAIIEIRHAHFHRYTGNYEEFLEQRQAREEQHWAAYKNQQRQIAHLMEFVDRFRAKNTKATQAQSKLKQIERMEKIEAPVADEKTIRFSFPQPARSGLKVITLKEVAHSYGANVVYEQLDFEAQRGQRIVLTGPNGAGKSTLLKLLAGVLPVQKGTRQLGHNVKSGYFAQHRIANLRPDQSVFEEALDTPQPLTEQFIRTLLGAFLFRGDDIHKPVQVLSGGEKTRLALVKLLLDPPNLLLMDEPTTHLDMASIDALIQALEQYQGTLIFISHDVHFIRSIANHVVHVKDGKLRHFPGGYDYYSHKTQLENAAQIEEDNSAPARSPSRSREQKRSEAEHRQQRYKFRKAIQDTVHQLETQIAELEQRQNTLATGLENPETYQQPARAMQINRELSSTVKELKELTAQWETEAAKLAELDG
jgi:ATP-binding cassette, subfamily F, member 3